MTRQSKNEQLERMTIESFKQRFVALSDKEREVIKEAELNDLVVARVLYTPFGNYCLDLVIAR